MFLALKEMTGWFRAGACIAALFAVHPLRAESVAWVTERKDVLSGVFFMATLLAYLGYARRPSSAARYAWVIVFFALGLMSKPMLVTLPLVLLLLDYWPLERMKIAGWHVPEPLAKGVVDGEPRPSLGAHDVPAGRPLAHWCWKKSRSSCCRPVRAG